MARLPWFKFPAHDWISSLQIRDMTDAQKGQLIDALVMIWCSTKCGIDQALAEKHFPQLNIVGNNGVPILIPHPDYPDLVTHEWVIDQMKEYEYQVEKGREGARVRWGAHRDPNPTLMQNKIENKNKTQKENKEKHPPNPPKGGSARTPKPLTKEMQAFRDLYPRERWSTDGALKDAWRRAKKRGHTPEQIIAGLEARLESYDWEKDDGKYIPKEKKFLDEQKYLFGDGKSGPDKYELQANADEHRARIQEQREKEEQRRIADYRAEHGLDKAAES